MTKAEIETRMDSAEFSWWLAKESVDPLPDFYWMAALVASTVARAMGSKGAKLEHFLPRKKARRKGKGGAAVLGVFASIRAMAQAADAERRRQEA